MLSSDMREVDLPGYPVTPSIGQVMCFKARQVIAFVSAIVVLSTGVTWAVLLPSITTCPSCPPYYHPCNCATDSRIPLRLVISVGGLLLAFALGKFARSARRLPWPQA